MDFRRPELSFSTHGYELVSYYGGGMYGRAYLVRQIDSEELRIAKTVDLTEMISSSREAAIQEANLLLGFTHRNIVPCYEAYVQDDSYLVMIMEYCQGGDLSRVLNVMRMANRYFTEEEVKNMLRQLLSALAFIHENRILHRDLKPSNILISKTGELKVADFGVARVLTGATCAALTSAGTPNYMAPEMCKRKPYSFYSDMWSLGCVLYEMMTLTTAFQGESIIALAWSVCFENPSPIRGRFSPTLEKILMMLLSKEPDRRLLPCALLHHDYFLQPLPGTISASASQADGEEANEGATDRGGGTTVGQTVLDSVPEEDDIQSVDPQVLLTKLIFSMWMQQVPPLVCIVTSNPAWPTVVKERVTLPLIIKAGFRSNVAQILMDIIREEQDACDEGASSPCRRTHCPGSPMSTGLSSNGSFTLGGADAAAEEAINNLIASKLDATWADRLGQDLRMTFSTAEFVALVQFIERMTNSKFRTLKDLLSLSQLNNTLNGAASFMELLDSYCSEYLDKNELIVRLRWAVNEILKDNSNDHMTVEGTTNAIAELATGESNVIDKQHFLRVMGIRFAVYSNASACAREMYLIVNKDQYGSVNWSSTVEFLLTFAKYDGDPEKNQERDINKALVASNDPQDIYESSNDDNDNNLVTTSIETSSVSRRPIHPPDLRGPPNQIKGIQDDSRTARSPEALSERLPEIRLTELRKTENSRYVSDHTFQSQNADGMSARSPMASLIRRSISARVEARVGIPTQQLQSAVDETFAKPRTRAVTTSGINACEQNNSRSSAAEDNSAVMRVTRSLQRSDYIYSDREYRNALNNEDGGPTFFRQSFDLTIPNGSNVPQGKIPMRQQSRRGTDSRTDIPMYTQVSCQEMASLPRHLRNMPLDMEMSNQNSRMSRLEVSKLPNTPEVPDDTSSFSPRSYDSDEISLRRIKSTQGAGHQKQKLCLRSYAISDDRSNSSESLNGETSSMNWYSSGRINGRSSPGGRQNQQLSASMRRTQNAKLRPVGNKEMRKLTYWDGYPSPYQIIFDIPAHMPPFEPEERTPPPTIMELVAVAEGFLGILKNLLMPRQHEDMDLNLGKEGHLSQVQRRIRSIAVNRERAKLLKAQEQIRSVACARTMTMESIMICTRVLIAVVCDIMDGSLADVLNPTVREIVLGQYLHRQKLFQQIFSTHSHNIGVQLLFQILTPSVTLAHLLESESEDNSVGSEATDDANMLDISRSHRDSFDMESSWMSNSDIYNAARRSKMSTSQQRDYRLLTSSTTQSESNIQQPAIIVDDSYARRLTHTANIDMNANYGPKRRSNNDLAYNARSVPTVGGRRRSSFSTDMILSSVFDNESAPSRTSSTRYKRYI